ncbi:hypothetical protein ACLOAV_006565 [Pseudogymnoascus australis]
MDISEKRADGPLLPFIDPGTHDTTQDASTIAAPSRSDRIYAAMETFNGTMERVSRSFDAIARFAMIAIQIICLSVVLWYSALLAYLLTTGRRATSPELALEVVCYIAPFLAFGTGVRFMELASVFFGLREVRTVPVPLN